MDVKRVICYVGLGVLTLVTVICLYVWISSTLNSMQTEPSPKVVYGENEYIKPEDLEITLEIPDDAANGDGDITEYLVSQSVDAKNSKYYDKVIQFAKDNGFYHDVDPSYDWFITDDIDVQEAWNAGYRHIYIFGYRGSFQIVVINEKEEPVLFKEY